MVLLDKKMETTTGPMKEGNIEINGDGGKLINFCNIFRQAKMAKHKLTLAISLVVSKRFEDTCRSMVRAVVAGCRPPKILRRCC
jgi:hypothetical protein